MRRVLLCLTAPTQSTTESCRVCRSRRSGGTETEQKPNNRQREPRRCYNESHQDNPFHQQLLDGTTWQQEIEITKAPFKTGM